MRARRYSDDGTLLNTLLSKQLTPLGVGVRAESSGHLFIGQYAIGTIPQVRCRWDRFRAGVGGVRRLAADLARVERRPAVRGVLQLQGGRQLQPRHGEGRRQFEHARSAGGWNFPTEAAGCVRRETAVESTSRRTMTPPARASSAIGTEGTAASSRPWRHSQPAANRVASPQSGTIGTSPCSARTSRQSHRRWHRYRLADESCLARRPRAARRSAVCQFLFRPRDSRLQPDGQKRSNYHRNA